MRARQRVRSRCERKSQTFVFFEGERSVVMSDVPMTPLGDARSWLAAIAASSDDAIVGKDLNGIVTSWNKAAGSMFGYASDEIIGQPIGCIIPPERIDEEASIL